MRALSYILLTAVAICGPAVSVSGQDFNGDGRDDIFWRHNSGALATWFMNGAQIAGGGSITTIDPAWHIPGIGDYDGDGKTDVLWRDSAGNVAVWLMNGLQIKGGATVANVELNWRIVGTGDYNGDGRADILWRHGAGGLAIWFMNGVQVLQGVGVATVDPDWLVVASGDYNGDGRDDILWRHVAGLVATWLMNGSQVIGGAALLALGEEWAITGSGDFNGDSKTDILWRHSNGPVVYWLMDGASIASGGGAANFDPSLSIVGAGDYNGDRRADLLGRTTSGQVVIAISDGTSANLGVISTAWRIVGGGPMEGPVEPGSGSGSSRACGSLSGFSHSSYGFVRQLGTLTGPNHRVTGCPGYLQGDSTKTYFAFTITRAGTSNDRVQLQYTVSTAAPSEVALALVNPTTGVKIEPPLGSNIIRNGDQRIRYLSLAGLPAGTWYIRTNRNALLGNTPSYDIVVSAP